MPSGTLRLGMVETAPHKARLAVIAVAIVAMAAACGQEPEPTPPPSPSPTVARVAPADTPSPATATPARAEATETPEPTETPGATRTPEPTSTPSPTRTPAGPQTGAIEFHVTDPPAPDVSQYLVTLSSVEVHKAKTGQGSPWATVVDGPVTFDLAKLEGVEELLGSAVAEAGVYTQIRMHVDQVRLQIEGVDGLVAAKLPSQKIQITRSFRVEAGQTTELLLDFEGDRSLVVTGAGEYIFKPVIKLSVPVEGGRPGSAAATEVEVIELSGAVASLGDTRLVLGDGTTFVVDDATKVKGAIVAGARVTVKATASDGTLVATEIELGEPEEPTATPEPTPNPFGQELFLEIESPQPEQDEEIVFSSVSTVTITGRTRVDAAVSVGDLFVEVSEDGRFEASVALEEGPNVIEVVASIDSGEERSLVLIVSFEPEEEG